MNELKFKITNKSKSVRKLTFAIVSLFRVYIIFIIFFTKFKTYRRRLADESQDVVPAHVIGAEGEPQS